MTTLEDLTIKFSADTNDVKAKLTALNGSLKTTEKEAANLGASFKKTAAVLAGAFTVAKVTTDLKSVVNEMDNISKAAQRLGVSTEALSKLNYVAKLADVEFGALEVSIRKMQNTLYDADRGIAASSDALAALNLNAAELLKLSPDEQFIKIASAVASVENPAQRTALAMDIFGRAGAGVINIAAQGEDALRALTQEAENLGVVFDGEAGRAAEEFNDSLTRLGQTWRGTLTQMASDGNLSAAVDGINALTKAMITFVGSIGQAYGWYVKLLAQIKGGEDVLTDFSPQGQAKALSEMATQKGALIDRMKKEMAGKLSDPNITPLDKALVKKKYEDDFNAIADELKVNTIRVKNLYQSQNKQLKTVAADSYMPLAGGSSGSSNKEPLDDLLKGTTSAKMAELQKQIEVVNKGYEQGKVSLQDHDELIGKINDDMRDLNNNQVDEFTKGLAEGLFRGVRSWDDFKRAGLNALAQLAQMATQELFSGIFGSKSSGSGSLFSGLFNSAGSGLTSLFSGLGFANGGEPPVGKASIVGENGAELFIPKTAGTIVPNGKFGGTSVNQYITINATAPADVDRRILAAMPRFKQEAITGVQQAMTNGGKMSRTIGAKQ